METRATAERRRQEGTQNQTMDNEDPMQATNPTPPNGTVHKTSDPAIGDPNKDKTEDELIEEFMRKNCPIGLDWYVPNLYNTQVKEIIKQRLSITANESSVLFNCPLARKTLRYSKLRARPHDRSHVEKFGIFQSHSCWEQKYITRIYFLSTKKGNK